MAERHLTVRRQVAASCESVWAVFADFPNLADHWDGIKSSRPLGDQTHGVGARRQVDLKPVGTLPPLQLRDEALGVVDGQQVGVFRLDVAPQRSGAAGSRASGRAPQPSELLPCQPSGRDEQQDPDE